MKRIVIGMGYHNPANIVAPHNAYHPTIDLDTFKTLFRYCDGTHNQTFADELVGLIIADITTDNAAGNVANNDIRNYYRKYYDVAYRSSSCSQQALQALYQLV